MASPLFSELTGGLVCSAVTKIRGEKVGKSDISIFRSVVLSFALNKSRESMIKGSNGKIIPISQSAKEESSRIARATCVKNQTKGCMPIAVAVWVNGVYG